MNERRSPVLSVLDVSKRFIGTVALRGVSVDLQEDEILGLVGENGAGKSTLMKILSGVYPHTEYQGSIVVGGIPCAFKNPQDAVNQGIAMIYQELQLELDLSMAENILLGMYPKTAIGTIDWKKMRATAINLMAELQVEVDVGMHVRSLSPSMQQLVCIARALARNPKILILDEPTAVLTETEAHQLMGILQSLRAKRVPCIYISHKLDEVFNVCNRIIVLRDGEKVSEHRAIDGYQSSRIIEDMIGRKLYAMYPSCTPPVGAVVLEARQVSVPHPYAYGEQIIRNVSFAVRTGEILGIAGLVGSGRSELVNALFGLSARTSGEIWMEGSRVAIKDPRSAIMHGIGLLTEERKKNGFVSTMDITGNMTLAVLQDLSRFGWLNHSQEHSKAFRFFHSLRIKAPSMQTLVQQLSGGNQQKVILAKWLMTRLKVLILDEPTRGIDVGTKAEIYQLLMEVASKGVSIVLISSEIQEVLALSTRVIVLGKGRIVGEFAKGSISETEVLRLASGVF